MKRTSQLPILMTTAAALLWGSSFSVVKVGLRYLDPYTFVLLRFVVAAALLAALCLATRHRHALLSCLRDRYALLLGLMLAASFGLQFRGQTGTTAAKTAMIINSSVVLVGPLGWILLGERMGRHKLAALAVGMVGVYLVTGSRGAGPEDAETLTGNLLIGGSALGYALYVVLTRMAVTRRDFAAVPLLAAAFIWSLPVFLVLSIRSLAGGVTIAGEAWLAVLYLAVFCSALAFLLWTAAMRHTGALTSAILLLAELVFGVAIAAIFLSESLTMPVIAGCGLIGASILIVSKGRRARVPGRV
jgi:drug/metabolite transporter (DMT)-like permease